MNEVVYLNGRLVQRNRAKVSALDYGFLYGFGLFETMRAYKGRLFRLDEHLKRLAASAKVLDISINEMDLKDAVMKVMQINRLSDARVRITVSPGEGAINADPRTCGKTTVLVVAEEYMPIQEEIYNSGFRAIVSSFRRYSQSPVSRLKSTSYLTNVMARHEARLAGADEAICLNEKGLVAEASMSNIFRVTVDGLKTPRLESGILPGITRQVVLDLASQMGINNTEGDIDIEELYTAEEVFLTSSLLEIMPLTVLDNKNIGNGRVGDNTKGLMKAYKKLVSSKLIIV